MSGKRVPSGTYLFLLLFPDLSFKLHDGQRENKTDHGTGIFVTNERYFSSGICQHNVLFLLRLKNYHLILISFLYSHLILAGDSKLHKPIT